MSQTKARKCFRKKSENEEDQEEELIIENTRKIIKETKEFQELRKRPSGINVEDLSKIGLEPKKLKKDPLKLHTGGYVDIKSLKKGISEMAELDGIGTTFAMETNQRDEDAMMLNYVEEQMAKRKAKQEDKGKVSEEAAAAEEAFKRPEDALYELPANIRNLSKWKKTEESMSNQMLSGIPEVDLGIEVKIKNIEETEAAKLRLVRERMARRERVSQFVPSNMAVNFVQHNRFNIEEATAPASKVKLVPTPTPVLRVGGAERLSSMRHKAGSLSTAAAVVDKATDDFHYEKFKKYMRRF